MGFFVLSVFGCWGFMMLALALLCRWIFSMGFGVSLCFICLGYRWSFIGMAIRWCSFLNMTILRFGSGRWFFVLFQNRLALFLTRYRR
jgi:hypothetical protein